MSKQKLLDGEEVSENGICWASFLKDSIPYHRYVLGDFFFGKDKLHGLHFELSPLEFKKWPLL